MRQDTNLETIIEVKGVCKSFNGKEILKGINLELKKGEVVAIIGPSGSGKTTLLRCMNFLETADSGTMFFDGHAFDMKTISRKNASQFRKKTAFVFQNFNLFRNKTAIQNITEGLIVARKINRSKAEVIAKNALDKVGLEFKYDSFPQELSGGQQQRVAIARALAVNPEIIFFDEPTSALDPELIGEVLAVMKKLADDGMTMIVVTHEMAFVKNVSSKVLFIEDGLVVEENSSKLFFNSPKEDRVKLFLQKIDTSTSIS